MDFDKLKENNGIYLYQDDSFNTITIRLTFLGDLTNRESAICDLLCHYLAVTNKNFKSDDDIITRSKELYSMDIYFYNKLYSNQKVFGISANMICPETVGDDYYSEAFEFIRQMLLEPDFTNQEMLDYCKRCFISGRRVDLEDNEEYADNMYSSMVLPEENRKYDYSTDMEYISELINSVTLNDIKNEYEKLMKNFYSGFVFGNMPEDKFNEFVSHIGLTKTNRKPNYDRDVKTIEGDMEIEKDCEQSYIFVTYDLDSLTYSQLKVLSKILNSTLGLCYQILREKYGLVYSAEVEIMYYLKKLYFYGEIDQNNKEKFVEVVEEIVEILKDKGLLDRAVEVSKNEIAINEVTVSEDQERIINSLNDYVLGLYEGLNRTEVNREIMKMTGDNLISTTLSLKRKNVFMVRSSEDE